MNLIIQVLLRRLSLCCGFAQQSSSSSRPLWQVAQVVLLLLLFASTATTTSALTTTNRIMISTLTRRARLAARHGNSMVTTTTAFSRRHCCPMIRSVQLRSTFSTVPETIASNQATTHYDKSLVGVVSTSTSTRPPAAASVPSWEKADDLESYFQSRGIASRPKPGGNWNVQDPVGWAKHFGRRSASTWERLQPLINLKPGDEGYFDVHDLKVEGVTIVRTKEEARKVLEKLYQAPHNTFHACDTEVMDIDLKSVGPVGNGYVTCLSMFSGPNFDYGLGDGPGTTLWVDNLDDACGILQEFKAWLEDERFLKVWHNVGFDRHVLWNEGINVQGFGGDTMHMARLYDTSRTHAGGPGYSLEALTGDLLGRRKRPMKELFGVKRKRKDGTDGSLVDLPAVEILQRDPHHRTQWIIYAAYDASSTWYLRDKLQQLLSNPTVNAWIGHETQAGERRLYTMWDYYWMHMRPFGQVLTDMERRGIRVDAKDYLAGVEKQARLDRQHHETTFRAWAAAQYPPHLRAHGLAMNPASAAQLQTFLFGGSTHPKTKEGLVPLVRAFKVPRSEIPEPALEAYDAQAAEDLKQQRAGLNSAEVLREQLYAILDSMSADELKQQCESYCLKKSGTRADMKARIEEHLVLDSGAGGSSSLPSPQSLSVSPSPVTGASAVTKEEMMKMSVQQLRTFSKELGMRMKYMAKLKKAELQEVISTFMDDQKSPEEEELAQTSEEDLRNQLNERGLPTTGTRQELRDRLLADIRMTMELSSHTSSSNVHQPHPVTAISGALEASANKSPKDSLLHQFLSMHSIKDKEPPKYIDVEVTSLRQLLKKGGNLKPLKFTAGGAPSVTADVLRKLAGDPFSDPPKYGVAFDQIGKEGCEALFSLCAIGSIDTMIANFLTSLQELVDEDSRVHGALNLNTETGRLSSRRPNLQNQPALEKDKYKIRKAFEASPGNNLIVADYGQLELRILASLTNCQSMISAFQSGGDFHSRTALDMFDYIRAKVDAGEVLLEWDYSKGDPPKPMLKDEFAAERRKAKTLNFSIAYGKTAHGLSEDWGVSIEEAENMLKKWYEARPEVDLWQKQTKLTARNHGYTRTVMGRYRHLREAMGNDRKLLGQAERASINTPIQGGAADIAMMAMIKINDSQKLNDLGWILLLQIHDEVILEGPEETAEEAFQEVISCMQEPWAFGLEKTVVPLLVDGSYTHKTWYDAK